MKVLVVAVTRMRGETGRCVGALTESGESVRLKTEVGHFPPAGTYEVGQWWDLEYVHAPRQAPHVEDVNVTAGTCIGTEDDLEDWIQENGTVWEGELDEVFEGCLETTGNGSLYVQDSVPAMSTGFWLPDRDLELIGHHYHYDGGHPRFAFAGTMNRVQVVKAETLVRLSLAGWWKQDEAADDFPLRCYAQVSGWY